jgi:hypothetical protein
VCPHLSFCSGNNAVAPVSKGFQHVGAVPASAQATHVTIADFLAKRQTVRACFADRYYSGRDCKQGAGITKTHNRSICDNFFMQNPQMAEQ